MKRRGFTVMTLADILRASDMGPSPTGIGAVRVGPHVGRTVKLNEAQLAAEAKRLRKMKGKTHAIHEVPHQKVQNPGQPKLPIPTLHAVSGQHHGVGAKAGGPADEADRQPRPVQIANG